MAKSNPKMTPPPPPRRNVIMPPIASRYAPNSAGNMVSVLFEAEALELVGGVGVAEPVSLAEFYGFVAVGGDVAFGVLVNVAQIGHATGGAEIGGLLVELDGSLASPPCPRSYIAPRLLPLQRCGDRRLPATLESITGMSPVQFQKMLRLQEARQLMLDQK